jgi:hypothetical protein
MYTSKVWSQIARSTVHVCWLAWLDICKVTSQAITEQESLFDGKPLNPTQGKIKISELPS